MNTPSFQVMNCLVYALTSNHFLERKWEEKAEQEGHTQHNEVWRLRGHSLASLPHLSPPPPTHKRAHRCVLSVLGGKYPAVYRPGLLATLSILVPGLCLWIDCWDWHSGAPFSVLFCQHQTLRLGSSSTEDNSCLSVGRTRCGLTTGPKDKSLSLSVSLCVSLSVSVSLFISSLLFCPFRDNCWSPLNRENIEALQQFFKYFFSLFLFVVWLPNRYSIKYCTI